MNVGAEIPGFVQVRSHYSVVETLDRLEAMLKQHGVLVFARIDFSGDAGRAGLSMRPEQMLIFGNPKAGTPLMVAAPAAGLDLPVKLLVWEAADGVVWAVDQVPVQLPAGALHQHGHLASRDVVLRPPGRDEIPVADAQP